MKNIGGQAVIEGGMMKSAHGWSVAVRDPSGEIQVKNVPLKELPRIFKLPLLRGFIALFHALIIGVQALAFSATTATEEEEEQYNKDYKTFVSDLREFQRFLLDREQVKGVKSYQHYLKICRDSMRWLGLLLTVNNFQERRRWINYLG